MVRREEGRMGEARKWEVLVEVVGSREGEGREGREGAAVRGGGTI